MRMRLVRWSGLCGIVGSILTLVMVFAATIISPWFRWDTNALSEMGVGEVSLLFNSAMIIVAFSTFFLHLDFVKFLEEKVYESME